MQVSFDWTKVKLVPSPSHRVLVVLGYPSVYEAADHMEEVLEAGPIGLEGVDDVLVDAMKKKGLHPGGVWTVRESGLGATARVPGEGDTWEGWEDASVAPERLGAYLRAFRGLLDRYAFRAALYGHFGQGCVHTRIPFDLRSREGLATFRSFVEEAADLVVAHGGSLRPYLRAGIPIVGLEPSCVSVFRDELGNLFPEDGDAASLARHAFSLDELLENERTRWDAPRLERKALVQGHCHQRAILQLGRQQQVLRRIGVDFESLDAGCCGMAGGFGYEHDHYAVSVACGERSLLPAVRNAPTDALIVADGFSCREQIRQRTGRRALHLAQVLQMAKQQGPRGPHAAFPEAGYESVKLRVPLRRKVALPLLLASGITAAALFAWSRG